MQRSRLLKYFKFLLVLTFILIPLGASVRAMNAGLACPDWPLCFGDFIPDYQPQVYFEFIHRVLAGIVGLYFFALSYFIFRSPIRSPVKWVTGFAILLLLSQIVMGGLTVLLHLHEYIVAAHLTMGTGFFAVLVWLYYSIKHEAPSNFPFAARAWSVFAILAVYGQIILGGLVASHYAALVCVDFPTCHGEWIPTLRGIIGLHVIHRLGAYALFLILVSYASYIFMKFSAAWLRRAAVWILVLIVLQIAIGIANVLLLRPPIITVLHLAVGTALFGLTVYMNRRLTLT